MAGVQSLDRMSGFRTALPFTFGCFLVGGLALAAFPGFSGFFSKDDVLAFVAEDGGFHWILYVVGYIGAFLTAVYTFRMIFRAFLGEPCPEARELEETGHLPPRRAGEPDDRGEGGHRRRLPRPRPLHRRARVAHEGRHERARLRRDLPGRAPAPVRLTDAIDKFLEPTFADSTAQHAVRRARGRSA